MNKLKKPVVVLTVGAIMQLFLGIIYVWSVFALPVSQHFNWSIEKVKLTSSFMLCFFVFGILAFGRLKKSTQTSSLIGGIMLSGGMILSGLLPKNMGFLIYITYGIIGGFGVGMAYNAIIASAQRNFPTKKGLATGISVCCFGFSTVVFAPLIETLVNRFGLQITFLGLGVIFAVITLICFRFITVPPATTSSKSNIDATKQFTTQQMLKTKQFYYITLSLMLGTSTYFILNPSFKTMALDKGLTNSSATLIVMISGIANALGRLVFPLLSDKIKVEKAAFLTIALTCVGGFLLIISNANSLIIVTSLIAFCFGGFSGVYPVLTGDYFGMQNMGSNYGTIMLGFALSALFMPIIISFIPNLTTKLFVLAILSLIGALLTLLLNKKNLKNN